MFIAMSFGFLGFALFLIQAKGDVDAEGSFKDYKLKFARLSPGLFVILCATVIIIFSATFKIDYGLTRNRQPSRTDTRESNEEPSVESPPDATDEELKISDTTKSKDSTKIVNPK